MARARSSGAGTGWAVATVLLGFGFIISLILAVVFRTQVSGAQQKLEQVQTEDRVYVTQADRANNDVQLAVKTARDEEKSGQSLVQYLIGQNRALKRMITGPDDSLATIQRKVAEDLKITEGRTLVGEVETLRATTAKAEERAAAAEKAMAEGRARVEAIEQERKQLEEGYTTAVAEVQKQLAAAQTDLAAYRANRDEQVSRLESHLKQAQAESAEQIKTQANAVTEAQAQVAQLQRQLKETTSGTGQERPDLADRVEPDGQIASLTKDRDLVYVDLARGDRVLPGMTFEVFERNSVIKLDTSSGSGGVERGKAALEVVRVLDTSSVARVVRLEPRAVVAVGDQIVNLAYDRHAVYRFYVHGKFDIDNVGQATMADRERIRAMITRWGAEVPEELTYRTDYLVLGEAPDLPEKPVADAGPEQLEAYEKRMRTYQEQQGLVALAHQLQIPVLNQNRFLSLVGYYRR